MTLIVDVPSLTVAFVGVRTSEKASNGGEYNDIYSRDCLQL